MTARSICKGQSSFALIVVPGLPKLTATGKPRCLPRNMTAMQTSLAKIDHEPQNLLHVNYFPRQSAKRSQSDNAREIVVWDSETQSDRAVRADQFKDDVENIEPGGKFRLVQPWALPGRSVDSYAKCRRGPTSMMHTSHRANPSHQISNASCLLALHND